MKPYSQITSNESTNNHNLLYVRERQFTMWRVVIPYNSMNDYGTELSSTRNGTNGRAIHQADAQSAKSRITKTTQIVTTQVVPTMTICDLSANSRLEMSSTHFETIFIYAASSWALASWATTALSSTAYTSSSRPRLRMTRSIIATMSQRRLKLRWRWLATSVLILVVPSYRGSNASHRHHALLRVFFKVQSMEPACPSFLLIKHGPTTLDHRQLSINNELEAIFNVNFQRELDDMTNFCSPAYSTVMDFNYYSCISTPRSVAIHQITLEPMLLRQFHVCV